MRCMAGTARSFFKRRMHDRVRAVGNDGLMATRAQLILRARQERFDRRSMRIVALRAIAGFDRHMHTGQPQPFVDITVTAGAQFRLIRLDQLRIKRSMRRMTIRAQSVSKRCMRTLCRRQRLQFTMAIQTQCIGLFGQQMRLRLAMRGMADRAVFHHRLVRGHSPYLGLHIIVALHAQRRFSWLSEASSAPSHEGHDKSCIHPLRPVDGSPPGQPRFCRDTSHTEHCRHQSLQTAWSQSVHYDRSSTLRLPRVHGSNWQTTSANPTNAANDKVRNPCLRPDNRRAPAQMPVSWDHDNLHITLPDLFSTAPCDRCRESHDKRSNPDSSAHEQSSFRIRCGRGR